MQDESGAFSTEAKFRFHYAWSFYWYAAGNPGKALRHIEKIIDAFHKNPDTIHINVIPYITNFGNLIASALTAKKYDKAGNYLTLMGQATRYAITQTQKAKFYYLHNYLMLEYMNRTGKYSNAVSIIPAIAEDFAKYQINLSSIEKAVILSNMSRSYFGVEQYDKSIYWLNRVRNEIDLNVHQDYQGFLRIFYLIVNYEAGKNDLLPYLIQSTYRFLKKKEQLYKFETLVIYFLRNEFPKANTKKELLQIFQKLKIKIAPLEKDPYERNAFTYFDYVSWLESKIENKPYAEVVREKASPSPMSAKRAMAQGTKG